MIITLVFFLYVAPDISNDTREQTQGGEEVVQVAGM